MLSNNIPQSCIAKSFGVHLHTVSAFLGIIVKVYIPP